MAKGIKSDEMIHRNKIHKQHQEKKREQWCFTDESVFQVANSLREKTRLLTPENEKDLDAFRTNITRLLIALHEEDEKKLVYQEQLSEALGIDIDRVKSLFHGVKKDLLNIYGLAIRNKHGVGYRIADLRDVLIELEKSVKRLKGMDLGALAKIFTAKESIKKTKGSPTFSKELLNTQENFLTEIDQAYLHFSLDHDDIKEAHKNEFQLLINEVNEDLANRPGL